MKKICMFLLITIISLFVFNVYAEDSEYIMEDSTTQYSIEVTAQTGSTASILKLKLNGMDTSDSTYYLWFTDAGQLGIEETEYGCKAPQSSMADINGFKSVATDGTIYIYNDWYMLNGYTSAYVIKRTRNTVDNTTKYYCTYTKNPITITRPDLPTLGNRYKIYLFTDEDSRGLDVFAQFPYTGENGSHTRYTKIGKINDSSLIKKLAKQQSGSMNELLNYAKNNQGTTYTYNDNDYGRIDIKSFSVTNGAYYFIYTTYQNDDGLYRDLSDVTVVQGKNGMLVSNVEWPEDMGITDRWETFVSKFKEFVNEVNAESEADADKDINITVTNTDTSLTAVYTEGDYSYTYNITYENGIITFTKEEETSEQDALANKGFNRYCIYSFAKTFGYDIYKVADYIATLPENHTLEEYGVRIELGEYKDDNTLSNPYIKLLKLDLENGLKKYTVETSTTDGSGKTNPNTGVIIPVVGLSLLAASGVVIYFKKRKRAFM